MIGSRIRHIRIKKGVSLAELSKRTGIIKSYLNIIENNLQSNPTQEYIARIATALGVEQDYLISGKRVYKREGKIIGDYFASFRECVAKTNDKDLEEMKDYIEFTLWKRAQIRYESNTSQ